MYCGGKQTITKVNILYAPLHYDVFNQGQLLSRSVLVIVMVSCVSPPPPPQKCLLSASNVKWLARVGA